MSDYPTSTRSDEGSIGRGCRFLSSRAWVARLVYGSALFSNITSTTGSEGRRTRRETPSDHARLNFRVGGNGGAGAENDGDGGEEAGGRGRGRGGRRVGVKRTRGTRRLGLRNSLIDRELSLSPPLSLSLPLLTRIEIERFACIAPEMKEQFQAPAPLRPFARSHTDNLLIRFGNGTFRGREFFHRQSRKELSARRRDRSHRATEIAVPGTLVHPTSALPLLSPPLPLSSHGPLSLRSSFLV